MNLLLIVVFGTIAEVLVWIGVGDLVGSMWYVFFWFIIAFFIGLNLVRSSTSNIMPQLQQMQMTGQLGGDPAVTKKLAIAMSGFLLMLPGLISDVLAVLVLIPAVQTAFRNALMKTMAKRQQAMMDQMMGGGLFEGRHNMKLMYIRKKANHDYPKIIEDEVKENEVIIYKISSNIYCLI